MYPKLKTTEYALIAECTIFIHNKMKLTIRRTLSAIKVFSSSIVILQKLSRSRTRVVKNYNFHFIMSANSPRVLHRCCVHPEGISIIIRNVPHQIIINKMIFASVELTSQLFRVSTARTQTKKCVKLFKTKHNNVTS